MKILKSVLAFIIILVMFLPVIQGATGFFNEVPLKGAYERPKIDTLNRKNWFERNYQKSAAEVVNDVLPLRPFLVRIYNQADYLLLGSINASGIVEGRNKVLFETGYIDAVQGKDYKGEQMIIHQLEGLRYIQKTLKKENVDFIFIISPSKARFYPDLYPHHYHKRPAGISNYDKMVELLGTRFRDIHFNNMDKYFCGLRNKSDLPVYPRGGIHWTTYAARVFAFDSMLHYMASLRPVPMLGLKLSSVYWTSRLDPTDEDMVQAMNLLLPLYHDSLPYPRFSVTNITGYRPNILMISDSYYWNIYSLPLTRLLFRRNDFWYYNRTYYPLWFYTRPPWKDMVLLKHELKSHDFIILMATELNIPSLFNFVEDFASCYDPNNPQVKAEQERKKALIGKIKYNMTIIPEWMELLRKKAVQQKLPLEKIMEIDAEYMYQQDLNKRMPN